MLDNRFVGENIARIRKERKLTQQELANKLFVTVQAVSGWERGQFLPSVDNLVDLSKVLECNLTDILDEEELSKCVDDKIATTSAVDIALLIGLAPFLDRKQIEKMSGCVCGEFDAYMLCGLAPFVSSNCLFNLLLHCDEIPYEALCGLMPFLEPEQMSELLKKT